jgi:hypothetical protein
LSTFPVDILLALEYGPGMIRTAHGTPAVAALLETVWTGRRAAAFDEACPQG